MPNWVTPCAACKNIGSYRAIGGDGLQPARVLAIMERPGREENLAGRVACGKTGQELDGLYLPLAGLDRSEIRVCNTVLCGADNNKTPTDKEVAQCTPHHIPEEIRKTNPEVILLLGSTACSLVPGVRLELHHGIPQPTSKVGTLFGWEGWLVPMYHPSIGLHESRWMQICMEDWKAVGEFLNFGDDGDPSPEPVDYHLWDGSATDVGNLEGPYGVDTESHAGCPWSVQVSAMEGTGTLFRCDDPAAMIFVQHTLPAFDIVLHNAAYDLEVLRKLGIRVRSYRDTMQESFHLGNLPQGLKPLVYRLFRHTMTSYEETVRPASIRALQEWMLEAIRIAQADLSFTERVQLKTKVREKVSKGPLESLLTRCLRLTDAASEYDPWERLDTFWRDPLNEWMVTHVEARVGRYPILGIANCTMDEAVRYAVGDADWTGRVAVELTRRREGAFRIYPGDRDAS